MANDIHAGFEALIGAKKYLGIRWLVVAWLTLRLERLARIGVHPDVISECCRERRAWMEKERAAK